MSLSPKSPGAPNVVVLMPLRNDWESAGVLLRLLDEQFRKQPVNVSALLVDDGSTQAFKSSDFQHNYRAFSSIGVLHLRRNLGHQRAITIGLVHIHQLMAADAVLVMDSDGEDTPEGALELLEVFLKTEKQSVAVFAERSRRTESLKFKLGYIGYKALHRLLTGMSVRVGNFSILPARHLETLVVMSELWNHYAAAYFRSGLPLRMIPIERGYRIAGNSKMNLISLIAHGMSAISVFGDIVGVRVLVASVACLLLAVLGIVAVIVIRFGTSLAVPGWATYVSASLAIIIIQFLSIAVSFTFTILASRTNVGFVPLRDYSLFVRNLELVNLNV